MTVEPASLVTIFWLRGCSSIQLLHWWYDLEPHMTSSPELVLSLSLPLSSCSPVSKLLQPQMTWSLKITDFENFLQVTYATHHHFCHGIINHGWGGHQSLFLWLLRVFKWHTLLLFWHRTRGNKQKLI